MTKASLRIGFTIAAATFALAACQTPTMEDFNALKSEVASLQSRVSAVESTASQASASAAQCQQVCERADRMFQQGMRK